MKRFLSLALLLFIMALPALAIVNITVVVPDDDMGEFDAHSYKILRNRIEQMMSNCGVQAGYDDRIVLYPQVTVTNKEIVNAGLEKLFTYDIELDFTVCQPSSKTKFCTESWELQGKGYSKNKAMMSAVQKLNKNDSRFISFINKAKEKVEAYFVANQASLLQRAKTLASQGKYEEAMSVLADYPDGVQGSNQVNAQLVAIYNQYCTANCSQMIQQARAAFAKQDYDVALALLGDVDATSSCASQAKAMENQIRSQILNQQNQQYAREERAEQRANNLEKTRIKAARDVAVAYYKRTYPRITYNAVFIH